MVLNIEFLRFCFCFCLIGSCDGICIWKLSKSSTCLLLNIVCCMLVFLTFSRLTRLFGLIVCCLLCDVVGGYVLTYFCELKETFLTLLGEIMLGLILIVLLIVSTYLLTLLLVMLSSEIFSPSLITLVLAVEVLSTLFHLAARANLLYSNSGPHYSYVYLPNVQK